MPIKKLDLQRSLRQKFGFEEVAGTKHEAVALFIDDRKVATTRFSRGYNEVGDRVIGFIARDLGVNTGFLKGMHLCTNSAADYVRRLREAGRLS